MRSRITYFCYQFTIIGISSGFLLFASPAQAPADPSQTPSPSSRSIAAIQEREFDAQLDRFHLCYGVDLTFDDSSDSRRRSCKAIVVHDLGRIFSTPGAMTAKPLRLHCQNSGAGATRAFDDSSVPVYRLKPNQEHETIEQAMSNHLVQVEDIPRWLAAKRACDFYLDCQKRLDWHQISFRVINRCLFQAGVEGRQILWESFRDSVFRSQTKEPVMKRYLASEYNISD